jgi:putative ABC transport system substrate-binding protein
VNRRAFITIVGGCIPAVPRIAGAQAGAKTKVIGVLSLTSPDTSTHLAKAGSDALRELGWVLGQNLTSISRYAYGRLERVPELAAELVRSNVDLIWTGGDFTIAASHAATNKIPIVFFAASDPVNSGFALTLARPGKNLTGISGMYHELNAKRLELFHTAVPKAKHIAIIAHPNDPQRPRIAIQLEEAARKLQVRLTLHDVGAAEQIPDAFSAIAKEGADGLLVAPHTLFFFNRVLVAESAAKFHLPAIYPYSEAATTSDGLMSYASDLIDQMRRSAALVDKVLKGAKPGDIPVEQPTKFELVINLKTARALGLTIPQTLLLQANQVIE